MKKLSLLVIGTALILNPALSKAAEQEKAQPSQAQAVSGLAVAAGSAYAAKKTEAQTLFNNSLQSRPISDGDIKLIDDSATQKLDAAKINSKNSPILGVTMNEVKKSDGKGLVAKLKALVMGNKDIRQSDLIADAPNGKAAEHLKEQLEGLKANAANVDSVTITTRIKGLLNRISKFGVIGGLAFAGGASASDIAKMAIANNPIPLSSAVQTETKAAKQKPAIVDEAPSVVEQSAGVSIRAVPVQ